VKPQVSQHFRECYQVTEAGLTEPGLQAGSPLHIALTCGLLRLTEQTSPVLEAGSRRDANYGGGFWGRRHRSFTS
jgi:hypothetical protein